jgi:predicted thioesterase
MPIEPGIEATDDFDVDGWLLTAAPQGSRCSVRALLREVRDDRKFLFDVEVVDQGQRTIGVGTHERRMIDAHPA